MPLTPLHLRDVIALLELKLLKKKNFTQLQKMIIIIQNTIIQNFCENFSSFIKCFKGVFNDFIKCFKGVLIDFID